VASDDRSDLCPDRRVLCSARQTLVQDALRNWYQEKFKEPATTAELKVFAGPPWFRWLIRLLVIVAFFGTVAGIAFISAAASQMLRIP
jgi:hypothetical protein